MRLKHLALAAGALLVSASAASAAIVTNDLNLRNRPTTQSAVIDTMAAGPVSTCSVAAARGAVSYGVASSVSPVPVIWPAAARPMPMRHPSISRCRR
jgi:hypothetical protein